MPETGPWSALNGAWPPVWCPDNPTKVSPPRLLATDARLADYDDSGWEVWPNVRREPSVGFTFAWYRISVELPAQVKGMDVAGSRLWFETNADNYGEIWGQRRDRPYRRGHRRPQLAPTGGAKPQRRTGGPAT